MKLFLVCTLLAFVSVALVAAHPSGGGGSEPNPLTSSELDSLLELSRPKRSGSSDFISGIKKGKEATVDALKLKKQILHTLFQAVKAVTGGVAALKGQLIKGSGYVVAKGGKLIQAGGDGVTHVGKKLINSAKVQDSHEVEHHHHHAADYEAVHYHSGHSGHAGPSSHGPSSHGSYEYAPVYYPATAYGPPKGGDPRTYVPPFKPLSGKAPSPYGRYGVPMPAAIALGGGYGVPVQSVYQAHTIHTAYGPPPKFIRPAGYVHHHYRG